MPTSGSTATDMSDATFIDALISLVIGGFLGWFTGGLYNLLNGRKFSGKSKDK